MAPSDSSVPLLKSLQHSCLVAGRKLFVDWVEASDLEAASRDSSPMQYHAAWAKVFLF